jgi:hypothetical protein
MAELEGPKIGDARSLWNFTPSPGWTREEAHALRLCLKKLGVGRWTQIVDSGVLPGKQIQQLNGQTQRLLGQQSLAEFSGMCVDIDAIRTDNNAKQGADVYRKSGLITNQGGKLGKEGLKALREANFVKYGLSKEETDAVELPEAPRGMRLGADAYMGKNHNKGGISGVKRTAVKRKREADVLTVDVDALSRPAKILLLTALRARLMQLRRGAGTEGMAGSADACTLSTLEEAPRVLMERQNGAVAAEGGPEAAATKGGASAAAKKSRGKKPAGAAKSRGGAGGKGGTKGAKKGKGASSADDDEDGDIGVDVEEENAAPPAAARHQRAAPRANDAVRQMVEMGFDPEKARDALLETGGAVEEAVSWLMTNCA